MAPGEEIAQPGTVPVLSEGAGIALGSVVGRLLRAPKRPRVPGDRAVVLAQSAEVAAAAEEEREERRKNRETKRAKIAFEANARVVPDAATSVVLEKALLATATRGAVALFNAVAKAQRPAKEAGKKKGKAEKGIPVSRESFMDMMRAGVKKDGDDDDDHEEEADKDDDAEMPKVKWLKDDFLSAGSKKLKDFDRELNESDRHDSSDNDDDSDDGGSEDGELLGILNRGEEDVDGSDSVDSGSES